MSAGKALLGARLRDYCSAMSAVTGTLGRRVQSYLENGWQFAIPYLTVYLAYAALAWPVHPIEGRLVPALTSVFLGLHFIHAVLMLGLLWHRARSPASTTNAGVGALPWCLLALFFWLPGVYLEFPADNWEHWLRINQWDLWSTVREAPIWNKASYFFAYTIVSSVPPALRELALQTYYVGACLLLAWQYYRLGRGVGLTAAGAFLFVILASITSGNNLFSFHRYYGLASTLPAQIFAVALVNWSIAWWKTGRLSATDLAVRALGAGVLLAACALNHTQSLAIGLVGSAGVVAVWCGEKRQRLLWAALAAIVGSVIVVLVLPRHHLVDEYFVQRRWLTEWYAFNLFRASPATAASAPLLGAMGGMNLFFGIYLLRRNHAAGWLTVTPVIALLLPLVVLPLANQLASENFEDIALLPRLFLGIPSGLALVAAGEAWFATRARSMPLVIGAAALVAGLVVLVPAEAPYFNRFWQATLAVPDDLSFAKPRSALVTARPAAPPEAPDPLSFLVAASGLKALAPSTDDPRRINSNTIVPPVQRVQRFLIAHANGPSGSERVIWLQSPEAALTGGSTVARISRHWEPWEVALASTGTPELAAQLRRAGWRVVFSPTPMPAP